MPRIKLTIEYDGSDYHGFQSQENAHSIQSEIEKQANRLTGENIKIVAAGRTDAGVHARGQVIAFNSDSTIPPDRWGLALNSFLPPDIRVLTSEEVSINFHPQFDAINKQYSYYIYRPKDGAAFYRRYALCSTETMDISAMSQACNSFQGRHNFQAFCASGSSAKTFERTVLACHIEESGPILRMNIQADGFLYNMVRIIMGTLLEVGRHRIAADKVTEIIQSRDRRQAGPTAPPQGLYLMSVTYPL